jgi:endonuclease YncB( thermonuclease family)
VVDGGTLRLHDRVVRLEGVEPPPRGTTSGPREGPAEDCAAAATNALAALVREAPVACRITDEDRLGRPSGICQASGTELNRALVAAGWARADRARTELKQAEAAARAGGLGVWASSSDRGW